MNAAQNPPPLMGAHHVSILSSAVEATHRFYTRTLGMPLLKKSVNQDSANTYHLFYGDAAGSVGSAVTFFDMPLAARERRGAGAFSLTTLRVSGEASVEFWRERLEEAGAQSSPPVDSGGWLELPFEDPSGSRLAVIDDGGLGPRAAGSSTAGVPAKHRLQGLGYSVLAVRELGPTRRFLTEGLSMSEERTYERVGGRATVFAMSGGGPHAEIHVVADPSLPERRYGSGGVHHLALTTANEASLAAWLEHLRGAGYETSAPIDRYYFHSGYVTGPEGVTVELATEGPGFGVDSREGQNVERLSLPPRLEAKRAEIEARLRPLNLAGS